VLNLANKGYTMVEIAEVIQMPDGISQHWYDRIYYGSVNHKAKAVYQRYLGSHDSNPRTFSNACKNRWAKKQRMFVIRRCFAN
jgi:alkyl sulfatase BDS1-like metallo-beta-lactamase superfamily hydrolase